MSIQQREKQKEQIEPFKVFVRIRPFLQKELMNQTRRRSTPNIREKATAHSIFSVSDNLIFISDPTLQSRKNREYIFDGIFTEADSNRTVFLTAVKPIIDNVLNGFNSTALAYGVTGTGKTHTIFGDISKQYIGESGIIIDSADYLFAKLNDNSNVTYSVNVSYLEIYNESVIDLLNAKSFPLMIVEDPSKGVVVPDLTEYQVSNSDELIKLIIQGNNKRTMAPTNQNVFSSRSHAILQICVEQRSKVRDIREEIIFSKLLIVDLAGSERGGLEKGIRREEGANINKSLLSLGNCINILSDKTKCGSFIPYRDSKLTRLLKDSLGGNILTVMIACLSPSALLYDESVNTLNYASRARKIQKKVERNVKEVSAAITQYKEIIDSLKAEILQLKDVIKMQQGKLNNANTNAIQSNIIEDEKEGDISSIRVEQNNNQSMFSGFDEYIDQPMSKNNININVQNEVISKNGVLLKGEGSQSQKEITPPMMANHNGNYGTIKLISSGSLNPTSKNSKNVPSNINVDVYKELLESGKNEDIADNIENLEKQIENIRSDKQILESYLETNRNDLETNSKYSTLKFYYDKYIELINEKLIQNIEQSMILKCNLREINELNATNNANLEILQKQIDTLSTLDSENNCNKLVEEVSHIKNAINENENLKVKIHQSFQRNLRIKKILKKILLSLLTNSKDNSMKYYTVLREKEELQNTASQYEKQLQKILQEQTLKNLELSQAQKEVELLRKKLEEKDHTISLLKQKKNAKEGFQKNTSTPLVNYMQKTPMRARSKNAQRDRSKTPISDYMKNEKKKLTRSTLKDYSEIMRKRNASQINNSQPTIKYNLSISNHMKAAPSEHNMNDHEFDIMNEMNNLSKVKMCKNYNKFINVKANTKNSLQLARIEKRMKSERTSTPIKLDNAENFINEYIKTNQNILTSSSNKKGVLQSNNSNIIHNYNATTEEDQVNIISSTDKSHLYMKDLGNKENASRITSTDDFFKSLVDTIKNPKLSRFLDNSNKNSNEKQ